MTASVHSLHFDSLTYSGLILLVQINYYSLIILNSVIIFFNNFQKQTISYYSTYLSKNI